MDISIYIPMLFFGNDSCQKCTQELLNFRNCQSFTFSLFSQGGSYNKIDVLLIIDAKSRDVGVSENGCFEKGKKSSASVVAIFENI